MPGRLEFETEFCNEAEEAVQHMQFDPGNGINPHTGELEPEMDLKMVVMDIYNCKLTARAQRKKSIFEHNLLEYRKNSAIDKKRTKEERDLFNKVKPFSRMTNDHNFLELVQGLEYEHNLRQAIGQLQDWRQHSIGDLKTGDKYETERAQRAARPAPTGSFDRLAGVRPTKQAQPPEIPSATVALVAPELPERLKSALRPASAIAADAAKQNGAAATSTNITRQPPANGTPSSNALARVSYVATPVLGTAPLRLTPENSSDLHLLTGEEKEICSVLRIMPKAYLVMKEAVMREAMKTGGILKRKAAREVCRIEAQKAAKLWEFFVRAGWISKV